MGMINKCQIWQGLLLLANIYTCIIFDCFKAFTIGDHFTSLAAILLLLAMDFYLMRKNYSLLCCILDRLSILPSVQVLNIGTINKLMFYHPKIRHFAAG